MIGKELAAAGHFIWEGYAFRNGFRRPVAPPRSDTLGGPMFLLFHETTAAVPEPSMLGLLGFGLAGFPHHLRRLTAKSMSMNEMKLIGDIPRSDGRIRKRLRLFALRPGANDGGVEA